MKPEEYRKVINEAIAGEVKAQKFYEDIAERLNDPYLKNMFLELSRDELKHQRILSRILDKKTIRTYFHEDRDYHVAETMEMPAIEEISKPADAFAVAMKSEEAAMKRYTALADNCKDADMKAIFEDLAAMEREHKFKMEESFVDVAYPEVW